MLCLSDSVEYFVPLRIMKEVIAALGKVLLTLLTASFGMVFAFALPLDKSN